MKKLRNSFIVKPLGLVMALLILNLSFYSCKKDDSNGGIPLIEEKTYDGSAFEVKTGSDGAYNVKTLISSQGEQYDLTYNFRMQDSSGRPVEGISISYNQINGKSLIHVNDEQGRYASTFFIGTPRELEAFFGGQKSKSGPFVGEILPANEIQPKNSEAIITLSILAIITIATVSYASVSLILNAYEVQMFYLTDYVTHTDDYIMYCKTFDQIAELIIARTKIVFNLTSIFISFIALGGGGSAHAIEIVNAGATFGVEELRNELYNQAVTAWGYSMSQLADKRVAVKVFPYEEDATFSGARNLFAIYTIEYDSAACNDTGGNDQFLDVTNHITGKTWLDRNLGANRVATSSNDTQAYGYLFQWGRAADGHQSRTSPVTFFLSSSNTPGHGSFIAPPDIPYDWRSPQNTNLWQGVTGVNNPCPSGYRIPTDAELNAERQSWSSNNSSGAFGSPLKLPAAGFRNGAMGGAIEITGSSGFYWSGTIDGTRSRSLHFFNTNANIYGYYRADGNSVRCIKN
jgi:uncharacterized protein (TIGR02145 family)